MTTVVGLALKAYVRLSKQSAKLAAARSALPAGSSRARVTSANARWARVAEERERVGKILDSYGVQRPEVQS